MLKELPFIHQRDRVARKVSDVSAADWRYQTRIKTYRNFTFVQLQLEIVVKHRSLYIKILFYPLTLYWTMYF